MQIEFRNPCRRARARVAFGECVDTCVTTYWTVTTALLDQVPQLPHTSFILLDGSERDERHPR
jgi:hypothetical protein